jgi:hypothetical protein
MRRSSHGSSTASRVPRRTKKLLVYLDQNFLSYMAKADIDEKVRPEYKEIFALLHQGFVDEKLVVPASWLHDVETSLASHLKERIISYQHCLGQVRLYRPDEIRNTQLFAAYDRFSGRTLQDPLRPEAAFLDHPDRAVGRFGISVDAHLETRDFRTGRHCTADELEELRQRLLRAKVTYEAQIKVEQKSQREEFLRTYALFCGPISEEKRKELIGFTETAAFADIPLLSIEARLSASLLTRKPTRRVKPSDSTDIDALSAYAPYMDVVCTDAFMADQLRSLGIAKAYDFEVFHARTSSLRQLKTFLEQFLAAAAPSRRPSITAFVMPPKDRREEAFQFFCRLGSALRAMGINEYGEIYAFDDGKMPRYELARRPGTTLPFYGWEDVAKVDLPPGTGGEALLSICRERCRSDHFVLIDEYKDIPETFMLGAAMAAEAGMDTTDGYRLYKKRP